MTCNKIYFTWVTQKTSGNLSNSLFIKAVLLFNICYSIIFYSVYESMKYNPESSNILLHKVEQYEVFHFHKCSGTIKIINSSYYFVWQDSSVRKRNSLKHMKERNQYFHVKPILKYRSFQREYYFGLSSCWQA